MYLNIIGFVVVKVNVVIDNGVLFVGYYIRKYILYNK
jgi:hypothetical protein